MAEVDVQQLAARVQRLEDIEAIKLLVVRYAQGADRGNDPDIMVPLFADTGVWDGGERFGVYAGKEAIRQFLAESGAFIGWTLHYDATLYGLACGRRGPGWPDSQSVLVFMGNGQYAQSGERRRRCLLDRRHLWERTGQTGRRGVEVYPRGS